MMVIILDNMPDDLNRLMARVIKARKLDVRETPVHIIVKSEPGRVWTKPAGRSSLVAYG